MANAASDACTRSDNLCIPQGSDITFQWPVEDGNDDPIPSFTGWTARAQARTSVRSADPLAEWTTEDGGITLEVQTIDGVTKSVLNLIVGHAESSAWVWSKAKYDIELVSPTGDVTRLTKGRMTVDREVTR